MNISLSVCLVSAFLLTIVSCKSIALEKEAVAIEADQWKSVSFTGNRDKRAAIRRRFISQPSLSNFVFDSSKTTQIDQA